MTQRFEKVAKILRPLWQPKKERNRIQMQKQKVIVIGGPTASGKTKLGVELAKRINGEIVSADSMQIYKEMLSI